MIIVIYNGKPKYEIINGILMDKGIIQNDDLSKV